MKALKRITALTLTFAMIIASLFSMCAFADITLTDVTEDNPNNQAIRSLVEKGVITGYEDGTFKPDNTITRAEFATILARATAGSVTLTATTAKFPDVALDYWANTYIAYAVNTGTVNGYEDGTFRPENPVSYGEAVKMLVCSLGYASVVPQTEPWYSGYITVAGQIGLTKNAGGTGDAEAKRGTIAQLVYDMASCKKLVQTGTDSSGKPTFSTKDDSEDNESDAGVLTAVFEDSLTGENYSLNKQQVMIGTTVYNIGDFKIDSFYPYLGKRVEIEYTDGSKKTIVKFEESSNTVVTVTDTMIDSISGRTLTYYEKDTDRKAKEITLSDTLNVVYNGYGVKLSEIDDSFIKNYLDVSTGEITFVNNNGKSDYDVAFVTSYDTYFVSGVTTVDNTVKITDSNASKNITLNKNDCNVYRVSSKGGAKTEATITAIAKNTVVSVAKPYNRSENTEVIVSTVKLSGAKVTGKTNNKLEISNTQYDSSDYYLDLLDADSSKYSVSVGDTAAFYFDFKDRLVYLSKTESTDPYAYLIAIDTGAGLNSEYRVKIMTASGSVSSNYYLKDNTKVNGTNCSPSEAAVMLKNSANVINSGKIDKVKENAEYSQLIKYKTTTSGSKTYLSEITTVDTASEEYIKVANISDGQNKYKYDNNGKTFTDSSNNKFIINSSTIIFSIPNDRSAKDKEFKKVSMGNLSDGGNYAVEAYDIASNIAKVVLMYDAGAAISAKIKVDTNCIFVERFEEVNDTENDKKVKKVYYYEAGSDKLTDMMTDELDTLDGVNPGDIIKIAKDNNRIAAYQRVFVGGKLYDFDSLVHPFPTFESTTNYIVHASGSTKNYYRVIHGTVGAEEITDGAGALTVVPQIVTNDADFDKNSWTPDTAVNITKSTKYYKWDSNTEAYTTDSTSDELISAEDVKPTDATKVVVISMGSSVKAVYILE